MANVTDTVSGSLFHCSLDTALESSIFQDPPSSWNAAKKKMNNNMAAALRKIWKDTLLKNLNLGKALGNLNLSKSLNSGKNPDFYVLILFIRTTIWKQPLFIKGIII